jgi:hypothetical protein
MATNCKKENGTSNEPLPTEVANAKTWYQSTYPVLTTSVTKLQQQNDYTGSTGIDFTQLVKPDWSKGISYTRSGIKVVELPLNDSSTLLETLHTAGTALPGKQKNSKTSFLVLNNNGTYSAYLMTIIADSAYLNNNPNKLALTTYNKRDTDFSGQVIYFTPKGKMVSGWFYSHGQLSGKLKTTTQTATLQSPGFATNAIKTLTDGCTAWYLDYYLDGELWYSVYVGTTCSNDAASLDPTGDNGGLVPPDDGGQDGCPVPSVDFSSSAGPTTISDGDPSSDPNYRNKVYTWTFLQPQGQTWSWTSVEKGVHHFDGTNWTWVSLDHVSDAMQGYFSNTSTSVTVTYAAKIITTTSNVGTDVASMDLTYQVISSINCKNSSTTTDNGPVTTTGNSWKVTDH